MSVVSIALWLSGVVLIGVGYVRARTPWSRYRMLKAQDDNVARYESWRGGARNHSATSASVAMAIHRRQARTAGAIALIGFVLVFLGFLVP